MAKSTEWLSKKQMHICFLSATSQKMLMSKENNRDRSELTFLSDSPASNTKKAPKGCFLKWRRVQDSNLCIAIHDDGLAIRCITTLPTLHVVRSYI